MDAAMRALRRSGEPRGELRILEIGGGVIEPLLLCAIARRHYGEGIACRVHAVDLDGEVTEILSAMRARRRYVHTTGDFSAMLYDPETASLSLAGLARAFASPENPTNPHLAESALVARAVAELAPLGLLEPLGLPSTPDAAARIIVERGLPARPELCSLITPEHAAMPDWRPSGVYDLIVANFSIQYPIMDGKAEAVAARLDESLAPDGLIAHAATYGAQVYLLRALLARGGWDVAFGVRELAKVLYTDDPEGDRVRLRIRTDALMRRDSAGAPPLAESVVSPAITANARAGSLAGVLDRAQPADGLDRPEMMAALWRERGEWAAWWSERETLLGHGGPLPCRIEWRGAATTG
jgi:hypothetical protein